MIDVLRGNETGKVVRFGHHPLPSFGAGAGWGKNDWRSLIRQMAATGLLRLDIAGYAGLTVTDGGRDLLRGEGAFHYRRDSVATPAATPFAAPRRTRRWETEDPLSGAEEALFAVLKALRLPLARERGVPAYVVFPDRTLIDMARRQPRRREEFAQVNSVGAAKLAQFTWPFLAAIDSALSDAG